MVVNMNILLIAINAKYIHSNPAVFSLKSCAGKYESYVSILEFTINQQASYILREIYKKNPDVIAFSCYLWSRNMIGELIGDLHKILPDVDIWAGGPEVSYDALHVIEQWNLRGVMTGPGERSFYRLVSAYVSGSSNELPSVLDGYKNRCSLNDIPFWYKDLSDFEHRILYYESSRGCPFSCSYCLSSIDKVMDFKSLDKVFPELDFFLKHKVFQVKFVDRTFNCSKDHALPILRYILEHDNGVTNFHFEIAADLLDEDYLTLLEKMRPGAVQLEIGVQSTYAKTISEIDRIMDFNKVSSIVKRISSWHNIHIHLDLIAGLPFEDFNRFRTSFNDVYSLDPEQLQLGFLKVLKGSKMEAFASTYGMVYTCLPSYEVLCTNWLSYEDICQLKLIEEVLEIYYNSGQFFYTLRFLISYFDTPFDLYKSLSLWYEKYDLYGIQSSRIKKYEILLEFGIYYITENLKSGNSLLEHNVEVSDLLEKQICMLKEYMSYDLYLREHIKNRPHFLHTMDLWKEDIQNLLRKESETHELFPLLKDCNYRELMKTLHIEKYQFIYDKPVYVVFWYGQRDPLTNNCFCVVLSVD